MGTGEAAENGRFYIGKNREQVTLEYFNFSAGSHHIERCGYLLSKPLADLQHHKAPWIVPSVACNPLSVMESKLLRGLYQRGSYNPYYKELSLSLCVGSSSRKSDNSCLVRTSLFQLGTLLPQMCGQGFLEIVRFLCCELDLMIILFYQTQSFANRLI